MLSGYMVDVKVIAAKPHGFELVVETVGGPNRQRVKYWQVPEAEIFQSHAEACHTAQLLLNRIRWVSVDGKPNFSSATEKREKGLS
jgi:hypothetical protein